jgi:hypothetical protein
MMIIVSTSDTWEDHSFLPPAIFMSGELVIALLPAVYIDRVVMTVPIKSSEH